MKKKGFTLIELLVVISIIALLLSILMPSLNKVKAKAKELMSLANMKNLTLAWMTYLESNESKLVSGQVWVNNNPHTGSATMPPNGVRSWDWVHPVIDTSDELYRPGMTDHERELAGIRKGALWPYLEDVDVYHSPGDRTVLRNQGPYDTKMSPFRSYAITDPMNGEWDSRQVYHIYTEISRPAERMVFLEEEDNGGENWGSWILWNSWWHDPLAAWHDSNKASIFGFADGRAERHRWTEDSTFFMLENQIRPAGGYPRYPDEEGVDIDYAKNAYHENYQ
jgi:prepilin-type N-terminal cleavage/methylation domain-containing protein